MPTPHGASMLFTLPVCCFYRIPLGRSGNVFQGCSKYTNEMEKNFRRIVGMSFRVVVNAPLVVTLRSVQTFRWRH